MIFWTWHRVLKSNKYFHLKPYYMFYKVLFRLFNIPGNNEYIDRNRIENGYSVSWNQNNRTVCLIN